MLLPGVKTKNIVFTMRTIYHTHGKIESEVERALVALPDFKSGASG
jgi:hypothetical protein